MKNITLLLVVLALTTASFKAQVTPVIHDGLYYGQDGLLFSGSARVEIIGGEDAPIQEIEVSNGLLHGTVKYFSLQGTLMEIGHYSNGQKNGQWLQYAEGGQLIGEAYYKGGLKDGVWTVWDESGVKRYHMAYSLGKKVDTWKMWDEHANLVSERLYRE